MRGVDLDNRIRLALQKAQCSWSDFMSTLSVFQYNINRRRLDLAEKEREALHVLLDDYMDQFLIAGKFNEQLSKGEPK